MFAITSVRYFSLFFWCIIRILQLIRLLFYHYLNICKMLNNFFYSNIYFFLMSFLLDPICFLQLQQIIKRQKISSFLQYFVMKFLGARASIKRRDQIVITKCGSAAAFTMMATRNIELIEISVGCNRGAFCYKRRCSDFLCPLYAQIPYTRFIIDLSLVGYKEKI